MKLAKRTLALVLAVVLAAAVMVTPASAAEVDETWAGRIGGFRQTSEGNYIAEYACAVQSILLGYANTKNIIANSGNVDGLFGSETARAVRVFQSDMGFESKLVDGIVGTLTWKAMAYSMTMNSNNEFISGSRKALGAIRLNSLWKFYFFNTYGSKSSTFHDCSK